MGDLPSQPPSKLGENWLYPTYKSKNAIYAKKVNKGKALILGFFLKPTA